MQQARSEQALPSKEAHTGLVIWCSMTILSSCCLSPLNEQERP